MDSFIVLIGLSLVIISITYFYFVFKLSLDNPTYNTSDLKIIRDMLNKIDVTSITKAQLVNYCKEIECKISKSANLLSFAANITSDQQFRQSVIKLKQILNKAPLNENSTLTIDNLLSYIPHSHKTYDANYNNKLAKTPKVNFYNNKSNQNDSDINSALEKEMSYMYEYGWDEKEPIKNKSLRTEKISNYEYYEAPYEREED